MGDSLKPLPDGVLTDVCALPILGVCVVTFCLICCLFGAFTLEAASVDRRRFEAIQLLREGRYAQAEPLLEGLIAVRPSAQNTYLLGLCRLKRWRLDSAAELLSAATEAEPERHAWLNTFAECQLERGRCDLAIELLDRAIAVEDLPAYSFNRAMCRLNLGRIKEAEDDLRRVVKAVPDHLAAKVRLADLLINSGRIREAEKMLMTVAPEEMNVEAAFLMARAQVGVGESERAEEYFRAVLETTPGHTGALYGLGRLLIADGRTTEGRAILGRFGTAQKLQEEMENLRDHLANHPGDTEVRLRLAVVLAKTGDDRECLEELENARRTDPDDPRIYRLMAQRHNHTGNTAEAERAEDFAAELEASQP